MDEPRSGRECQACLKAQSCVKGEAMREQLAGGAPVIVALPAEIDLSNAEQVYDQLSAALVSGAAVVIADFTGTRFCDCACLNRLLRVHNQAASHNAQLRLVIPPGAPVREVVKLLGLDQQLPVYASLETARQSLTGSP